MIRELDCVVLLTDRPADGLHAGAVGTVVHIYDEQAYEVEFVALTGETIALAILGHDEVRPVIAGEMMHVRSPERTAG